MIRFWLKRQFATVLVLLLPAIGSAVTTHPYASILSVEQTTIAYDNGLVQVDSDSALTRSTVAQVSIPTFGQVVGLVAAKSEGAVFWSGRQGANRAAAETFAQSTGRTTLEMTPAGQALEAAGGNISQWKTLSADFAQGASGEVNAFVGGARYNSVWNTVEKPILMQNPNVTKIIIQDATQPWKTKIIYK